MDVQSNLRLSQGTLRPSPSNQPGNSGKEEILNSHFRGHSQQDK